MKFLHLGDLHIGKSLGDFDLYRDQEYILNQILEVGKENHVDGVLIAGDIFDKSIPSEAAVRLFDNFICKLVEENFAAFMISGNHDSDERLNYGSALFKSNQVFICSKYNGTLYQQVLQDQYGKINIWLMPFVKASQVKRYYPEEEINSYDDAVAVLLKHSDINPTERNILVAHQFVVGTSGNAKTDEPKLSGSEGISVKNVGTIEKINASHFHMFDYVALGHIHSGQKVGREEIRYAGSPLKYSLSEVNHHKSLPVITIHEKENVDIELIPLKPMRDLRHIKGTMKQLLNRENVCATEDFIYATLTEESVMNDAMSIFQQVYPNTVKIDYDNSHTKKLGQIEFTQVLEEHSFEDMICDFYRKMYGTDISEEELKVMKEVAGKAGISYEAN